MLTVCYFVKIECVVTDLTAIRVGGYVGCLVSPVLCLETEECVDDDLFGSCRKFSHQGKVHRYTLTREERQELEEVLEQLAVNGFKWRHLYTQCIVTSLLLNYRGEAWIDPSICDSTLKTSSRYLNNLSPLIQDLTKSKKSYQNVMKSNQWNDYKEEVINDEKKINQNDLNNDHMAEQFKRIWRDFLVENENGENQLSVEDANGLEEILNNLSEEDIELLKTMILQAAQEDDEGQLQMNNGVKRVPIQQEVKYIKSDTSPDLVTRIVVNYNPDDNEEGEVAKEPSDNAPADYTDNNNYDTSEDKEEEEYPLEENKTGEIEEEETELKTDSAQLSPASTVAVPSQHIVGSEYWSRLSKPVHQISRQPVNNKDRSREPLPTKIEAVPYVRSRQKYLITMFVLCGLVGAVIVAAIVLYITRRHVRFQDKVSQWSAGPRTEAEATGEYQDLCRQHMQTKLSEKIEPVRSTSSTQRRTESITAAPNETTRTTSTGSSSTSSWTEEPVTSNMDISTGHLILSYMENHMQNKDRLQKEWEMLCGYDAEPCSIVAAIEPTNMRKNRYTDILPYEHCRVKLNTTNNVSSSDYINASNIMDHDPRNPAYIATQGPLPHTVADFWQMVWEQGSVVIVNLTRLVENTVVVCNRYWPEECSDLYHIYEVHLVSEHSWSEDYVVRSFYLKNLQTNETRTITQFHFLSWPNLAVPSSTKSLLEFRRKVNRSYKGRSCPVVVHCSDGAGRTGTYCLIDMVLNRLSKGAKEIDIAATLEHIRDQRINMVRTKEQFEFALSAVAQELHTMLQAPPTSS